MATAIYARQQGKCRTYVIQYTEWRYEIWLGNKLLKQAGADVAQSPTADPKDMLIRSLNQAKADIELLNGMTED